MAVQAKIRATKKEKKKGQVENPKERSTQKESKKKKKVREPTRLKT